VPQNVRQNKLGNILRFKRYFSQYDKIRDFPDFFVVAGLGFEPRLTASKAAVLPLDDPAKDVIAILSKIP
jgi:hypothetical protein